jgi:5'(3')-deoxyribonucleotidase
MRILLDVDGVLADFLGVVLDLFDGSVKREDFKDWGFSNMTKVQREVLHHAMGESKFWGSVKPIPGAVDGVKRLRENSDVFFLTSPWLSCKTWGYHRYNFLRHFFGADHNSLIQTSSKYLVSGDAFVDDSVDHVRKWHQEHWGGLIYVYAQPYNIDSEYPSFTWDNIPRDLLG